jgi:hypothetical protein
MPSAPVLPRLSRKSVQKQGRLMSEPLLPSQFVLYADEVNPGFILCFCSLCNRLVAASREMNVLEIAQRIHICRTTV